MHYYFENEAALERYYEIFSRDRITLSLAGAYIDGRIVTLSLYENGTESEAEATLNSGHYHDFIGFTNNLEYVARYEMIGNIFYLDLRMFILHQEIINALAAIAETRPACLAIPRFLLCRQAE